MYLRKLLFAIRPKARCYKPPSSIDLSRQIRSMILGELIARFVFFLAWILALYILYLLIKGI
jgi:hypothetical protein